MLSAIALDRLLHCSLVATVHSPGRQESRRPRSFMRNPWRGVDTGGCDQATPGDCITRWWDPLGRERSSLSGTTRSDSTRQSWRTRSQPGENNSCCSLKLNSLIVIVSYLTGRLSLKGDGIVEGIPPGSSAHVEACRGGEDSGVERREGRGCLARIPPASTSHTVRSLVSEVLSKLLVEPGGVHQTLTVGVQPLVTLVQTWVHLGPVQIL